MLAPLAALSLPPRGLPGDLRRAPPLPDGVIMAILERPHGTNFEVCLCWLRGLPSCCAPAAFWAPPASPPGPVGGGQYECF